MHTHHHRPGLGHLHHLSQIVCTYLQLTSGPTQGPGTQPTFCFHAAFSRHWVSGPYIICFCISEFFQEIWYYPHYRLLIFLPLHWGMFWLFCFCFCFYCMTVFNNCVFGLYLVLAAKDNNILWPFMHKLLSELIHNNYIAPWYPDWCIHYMNSN